MPDGSILVSRAGRRLLKAEVQRRERRLLAKRPKRGSARLILDPLEPRVLLNADTLAVQVASLPNEAATHDVLIQMVSETVNIGTQTQTVQRVQVVDQTSGGAILAIGDLAEIRAVAIAGAARTTLDLDSFGANTVPYLHLAGDGMTALAIGHAAGSVDWRANGDGSGVVAGSGANVSFTGVTAFEG